MAKQDLIKEAQDLGITVLPEDTAKVIQAKIDEMKAAKAASGGPAPEVKPEEKKTEVSIPGGLKRVKVTAEELAKLQVEKKLVGYDPATKEAIIR